MRVPYLVHIRDIRGIAFVLSFVGIVALLPATSLALE